MLSITLKTEGDEVIGRKMDRYDHALGDLRPMLQNVGEQILEEEEDIFAHQGAWRGRMRWRQLSAAYRAAKAKIAAGRPILTLTGAMRDSLTKKGAKGNVFQVGRTRLFVGSSLKTGFVKKQAYKRGRISQQGNVIRFKRGHAGMRKRSVWNLAFLHAAGTSQTRYSPTKGSYRITMPKRPPMTVVSAQLEDWLDIVEDYVDAE